MKDAQRAHKFVEVYDVILLDIEHLEHFICEEVALVLCLEDSISKLISVYQAVLQGTVSVCYDQTLQSYCAAMQYWTLSCASQLLQASCQLLC